MAHRRSSMRAMGSVLTGALLLGATGCSAPLEGVEYVLTNFAIAGPQSLLAGQQQLVLRNDGPTVHEFVVVQGVDTFDDLPLTADGQLLDEEADAIVIIAADEFIEAGAADVLVAVLLPGAVWFVCNIEGHFLGGMAMRAEVQA